MSVMYSSKPSTASICTCHLPRQNRPWAESRYSRSRTPYLPQPAPRSSTVFGFTRYAWLTIAGTEPISLVGIVPPHQSVPERHAVVELFPGFLTSQIAKVVLVRHRNGGG